jgi:hypothetical protein
MRKISLSIIVLLCLANFTAMAQKKYVYEEKVEEVQEIEEEKIFTDSAIVETEGDPDKITTVVAPPEKFDDEDAVKVEVGVVRDTNLYARNAYMPADSVNILKSNDKLAYIQRLDSLLEAKQRQEKPVKEDNTSSRSSGWWNWDMDFLTPILWILGIAFVGVILYSLFLKDGVFRRNSKTLNTVSEQVEEDVKPGTDMDRLIRQALQQRNYRLAIRYQYLNCLYKLADKGLVQFAADKTNYQYVNELTNAQQRNSFAELTLHYDYVWYGEFDIDESIYQKIEPGFTAFFNKI